MLSMTYLKWGLVLTATWNISSFCNVYRCQRSSQCPMCWQSISLKDPSSQELLAAVEHERNIRLNPPRNTAIFHHPTLGDFELQHLPVSATDAELEERIIQHFAAAAAMGRARHIGRRGQRGRASAHGRPQFLVFSTQQNTPSVAPASSPTRTGEGELPPVLTDSGSSSELVTGHDFTQLTSSPYVHVTPVISASGSSGVSPIIHQGNSSTNQSSIQSSTNHHNRPGPSDLQSFSESVRSRFNTMSMRYKESITKGTRGWKERLFSRNSNNADVNSEVRREVNAATSDVSGPMEHPTRGDAARASGSSQQLTESGSSNVSEDGGSTQVVPAAGSASN
ncbi:E3 ubiquitin-protein ligase RHF2A-like isoform X2 [Impatiens glandulifera]|uniref:E3 ubiquitin-protein ligase RHF2A-like isoform X2 n=1 Tax=Impatiens glandulifera TaxID=253017 RepID=UPI001FB11512|nr:E3 ubiquitin-protein ligase RHF2A-like isoform X2 [Impatiens glandulifera]